MIACSHKNVSRLDSNPLIGTWEMISAVTIKNDSTFSNFNANQRMIKIINKTHFAFFRHDLNQGQDSTAVFVSGGGAYSLKNNQYQEHLEYCNYREWENNNFEFTIEIKNDTLIQSGIEKIEDINIEHKIIEKYIRI